ncbi:MAG: redoxin domain-containing protein [Planctomycetaceae bacterium]
MALRLERPVSTIVAAWVIAVAILSGATAFAEDAAEAPLDVVLPVLVRDEGIRRELQLTPDGELALDRLLDEWNERLFGLRMLSLETDAEQVAATLSGFRDGLRHILNAKQQSRLHGLLLQSNGWRSLTDPAIAGELGLTSSQRKKIAAALQQSLEATRKLQQSAANGGNITNLESEAERIKAAEHTRITKVLTDPQKRKWLEIVGTRYDLTTVRQSAGKAPELQGIDEWLNSSPLTLAGQRGRVVVLHFIAADCINCVRNLPHYQKWHDDFADRGVTILGVHSPETSAERDASHVREKLLRDGVTYPVALDSELKTWDAWTNRMWPSTYLIDKRGDIRFWWYGELQWQGAEGERLVRERIEQLLAEEVP